MDDPSSEFVRLRRDVEWRDLDGQVVALDLATSDYLKINESGTTLWMLVSRGATEPQLTDALVAQYALEPDQARADVSAFVAHLRELSLVEESA